MDGLQKLARVAIAVGAVGSLVLMFLHGRPSVFLLILVTGWVLAPFIALAWADRRSSRWGASATATLYYLMVIISAGSLAVYSYDVASGATGAFWFVAVPGAAWLLILVLLPIAVLRRRARPS